MTTQIAPLLTQNTTTTQPSLQQLNQLATHHSIHHSKTAITSNCHPKKRRRNDDGPSPASLTHPSATDAATAVAEGRCSQPQLQQDKPSMDEPDHFQGRRASIILEGQVESVKKDVAPFLSKHIPGQYNNSTPQKANAHAATPTSPSQNNTSYCYRHRPDVKCRRQAADEKAMEELQKGLDTLPPTDQQAITHVWSLFSAAPAAHRNLMLKGILTQCCFPQLSLVASSVRDLIRIDFLTALPPEISFKILSYLDTTSLCKAAQVSQRWRMLADDDVVWHRMCEQHIDRKCKECGWGLPLLERKRLRSSKRQVQLRASNFSREIENQTFKLSLNGLTKKRFMEDERMEDGSTPGSPSKRQCSEEGDEDPSLLSVSSRTRPWKDVYSERYKVECNWRKGRCTMKVFKGHTDGVMCLQFDDSVLATGSYDSTVKIWDVESGKELRTLTGHTSVIRCLMFDENKLISGSLDRTLKIWNWRTGDCLSTLTGHTDGVVCLHFDGHLMASGSIDKTVKIWNFSDKSCTTLRGHTNWVNHVRIDTASRTVLSASDDMTVRLWDLDSKTCIRVFEGHVGQVQQVIPIIISHDFSEPNTNLPPVFPTGNRKAPPTHILTAALDSTMKVWEVSTGRCVKTLFGHVEGIWAVAADTLRLVSGAQDRMVKVWDVRTGKCQRTVTGHAGAVTCVGLSDSKMVTGSEDCEVRMYSFGSNNGAAGWDTPLEEVGIEGHHDHAATETDEVMG